VTVATYMAGRGPDIAPTAKGIAPERHDSRRIDLARHERHLAERRAFAGAGVAHRAGSQ